MKRNSQVSGVGFEVGEYDAVGPGLALGDGVGRGVGSAEGTITIKEKTQAKASISSWLLLHIMTHTTLVGDGSLAIPGVWYCFQQCP